MDIKNKGNNELIDWRNIKYPEKRLWELHNASWLLASTDIAELCEYDSELSDLNWNSH